MNIADFEIELEGRLHLRDAKDELMFTTEGKPMAVTMHSPGSKQYAKANAARQNRMLTKVKRKGNVNSTAEQNTAENAEFLADCTDNFENIEYMGLVGRDLFIAVYSASRLCFITEQVDAYLRETSNFTKPAATI